MAKSKKLNMEDFAEFFWHWRSQPPLGAIIRFARLRPDLKCYVIDTGSTDYYIVFAPSKKQAHRFLKETDSFTGSLSSIKNHPDFQG